MEKSYPEFKKKVEDALNKVSDETSKTYQDTMKELNAFKPQGKTSSEIEKFQKDIMASLDKNFNESMNKIKL